MISRSIKNVRFSTRPFSQSLRHQQVQEITSFEQYENLIKTNNVTLVDFYATWCGPCKAIEPFLHQLSEKVPEVAFARVDVDQQVKIAEHNGITAMPSIFFYQNGEFVDKVIGANLKAITEAIETYKNSSVDKK